MKLYLVRHGETDWNVRGMFYGWTDCDINEKGRAQARLLQGFFDNIEYDSLYSSDLLRAKHTAQIIGQEKNIPIQTSRDFRELYFGDWEDKEGNYIRKNHKQELEAWLVNWKTSSLPGGEAFTDFYERVTRGLMRIIGENKGKTTVIVAHNGPISAMLCHLSGAGPAGFWKFTAEQGCYTSLLISEKRTTFLRVNCPVKP